MAKVDYTLLKNISIKSEKDANDCNIRGLALLSANKIVLADYGNSAVKIVDTENDAIVSELTLPKISKSIGTPCDVTVLGDDEIAVTDCSPEYVFFLSVKNGTLEIQREERVNGQCCGIDYYPGVNDNPDRLAISYLPPKVGKVEITDMDCQTTKQFLDDRSGNVLFEYPSYVSFTKNGENLIVSDWEANKITTLSSDGEVLAEYKDPDLEWPYGKAVLTNGDIMVCGLKSQNVHLISSKGEKIAIVLDKEHGLVKPQAICVSEETNRLFVGGQSNDLKVYTSK